MLKLKIVSWNMLNENPLADDAIAFISSLDADIVCLQEVPGSLYVQLKSLRSFGWHAIVREMDRVTKRGMTTDYLAVLSKYEIQNYFAVSLPELASSWRAWIFKWVMRKFRMWGGEETNRQFLCVDFSIDGINYRVINAHLPLTTPQERARDLKEIQRHVQHYFRTPWRNILCGDLNVVEHPFLKLLNWLLGGRIREALPGYSEREEIENYFFRYGFDNPLRGYVTFSKWGMKGSQFDHILVPHGTKIVAWQVIPEMHGSDHHPITVTIE